MADWTTIRWNLGYHWKTVLIWGLGIGGAVVLAVWMTSERADAWVRGFQPFPGGAARVVVHRFCRSDFCGYPSQAEWQRAIRSVMAEWNDAGAAFVFSERTLRSTDDPCHLPDTVTVILADPDNLCQRDGPLRFGARTEFRSYGGRTSWQARIYVNAESESAQNPASLRRLLLHEFGHVVGLGHPDEAGQTVAAVMNSTIYHNSLQPDDIAGIRALYGAQPGADTNQIQLEGTTSDGTVVLRWTDEYDTFDPDRPVYELEISSDGLHWRTDLSNVGQPFHYTGLRNGRVYYFRIVANFEGERGPFSNAIRVVVGHSVEVLPREPAGMGEPLTGVLENPSPGALKSGVGLISGWVCDAEELEVSFDGGPRLFVPYGSERTDTADAPDGRVICGDTDNGFGLLMNYNNLGDGSHTVTLYADDVLVDQSQFTVTTLGTDFLRDVRGRGVITLSDGKQVTVQWEEATQGFTIIDYQPCVSQIAGACGDDG